MKDVFPLGDIVLLRIKSEDEFAGIVLPDTVKENASCVVVEEVGEKVTRVKKGDEVLLLPQSAIKFELPQIDNNLMVVREEAVLAVLKPMEEKTFLS